MQQLSIGPGPAGTLLVAGNPDNPTPTVIQNVDSVNILYIGKDVSVNPAVPFSCAPLYPGQTTIASGDVNIFGIADRGKTVAINVYEGMMSFFQPVNLNNRTLLGGYFISGSGGGTQWQLAQPSTPGFYLYSDDGVNPPVLALAISSSPGSDQWGNTWPGGQQIVGLPTLTNVFTVIDQSGNTIASIDSSGNISGQTLTANTDVIVAGLSLLNDLIAPLPLGIVNYGFKAIGATAWPGTPVGAEVALLELDQDVVGGRAYEFIMDATTVQQQTAGGSVHLRLRFTSDGTTPTTASAEATMRASRIESISTDAHIGPVNCLFFPNVNGTYKFLITGSTGSNTFQFKSDDYIRCSIRDLGQFTSVNNLTVLAGTGGGGGTSKQTYTKTYNAVEFANYYGDTGSYGTGPNSQRDHNGSKMYQGCPSGYINLTGDQYSFARFNYSQIASDLGAGVVNWVKLRLTNQHSWYNSGCNAVVGWSSYTGGFGSPFVPGAGTHQNTDHYFMGEGATVTHQMSGAFVTAITTGFTSIILGRSASYTSATDLNNYGYFAGAGSTSTCPQLQINYTK